MILLLAACQNTAVSRTTGTAALSMRSCKTMPGPTEGSWSTSPTRTNPAASGTAFNKECISSTSIMEDSGLAGCAGAEPVVAADTESSPCRRSFTREVWLAIPDQGQGDPNREQLRERSLQWRCRHH